MVEDLLVSKGNCWKKKSQKKHSFALLLVTFDCAGLEGRRDILKNTTDCKQTLSKLNVYQMESS